MARKKPTAKVNKVPEFLPETANTVGGCFAQQPFTPPDSESVKLTKELEGVNYEIRDCRSAIAYLRSEHDMRRTQLHAAQLKHAELRTKLAILVAIPIAAE